MIQINEIQRTKRVYESDRRMKFLAICLAGFLRPRDLRFIVRLRLRRNLRGINCRHFESHSPAAASNDNARFFCIFFLFFFFVCAGLKSHRHRGHWRLRGVHVLWYRFVSIKNWIVLFR